MTKPKTTPDVNCTVCGGPFLRMKGSHATECSTPCRFKAKYRIGPDGCWIWTGATDGKGYGQLNIGGRPVKAHRWSWENIGGQRLIQGLVIDHLCRNRACVNPDHMEQVTNRENCLRGEAPSVETWRSGVCHQGHSMANAYIRKRDRSSTCRTCMNERSMAYYYRKQAASS